MTQMTSVKMVGRGEIFRIYVPRTGIYRKFQCPSMAGGQSGCSAIPHAVNVIYTNILHTAISSRSNQCPRMGMVTVEVLESVVILAGKNISSTFIGVDLKNPADGAPLAFSQ